MTINYIVKGFDKNFYNFDAVFIPLMEIKSNQKNKQEVCGSMLQPFYDDFRHDFGKIMHGLTISAFKSDRVMAVKSEETGIYYIFVLFQTRYMMPDSMNRKTHEIHHKKHICCEKIIKEMIKYINNLDVKNILIHPIFNKTDFNPNTDSDFLAKTLESNIDRFSEKNIYILVGDLIQRDSKFDAFYNITEGLITPEECKQIYVKSKIEQSQSYTNSLIRIAEIETRYSAQSLAKQFIEDMNNSSCFFDEYIKIYSGTDSTLAKNANIDKSTISKIKSHTYKAKSKTVIIALAIALDLTVDDRKRFIKSAGFSYPLTEHDRFIEQQLKKKKYTSVIAFNKDIMDEHPEFVIETRSSRGYKNKKTK